MSDHSKTADALHSVDTGLRGEDGAGSGSELPVASCRPQDDSAWSFHDNLVREMGTVSIARDATVCMSFDRTPVRVGIANLVDQVDVTCAPQVVVANAGTRPIESGELYVRAGDADETLNTVMDFFHEKDELYCSLRTAATVALQRAV